MRAHGITPDTVENIVRTVSRTRYAGNVVTYNVRPDGRKREPGTLFTLRPVDSHGPGSRYADTDPDERARAVWAASYHAHGYVLAELFRRYPDARVSTATTDYRGAADFHAQTDYAYADASEPAIRTTDPAHVPHVRETVNVGAASGSVAPGDVVICGGDFGRVLRVFTCAPGHTRPGIRSDYAAVVVVTDRGERTIGVTRAHIGPDLRMQWTRDTASADSVVRSLSLS